MQPHRQHAPPGRQHAPRGRQPGLWLQQLSSRGAQAGTRCSNGWEPGIGLLSREGKLLHRLAALVQLADQQVAEPTTAAVATAATTPAPGPAVSRH